jgi:hypothetical protein
VPDSNKWGSYERYKFDVNSGKAGYMDMYLDIDSALQASSEDYYLLDVKLNVLNRMIAPMEIAETIQSELHYDSDYTFELTDIRVEQEDTLGNPGEWLVEATDIPMLVEKTVHFIYEVPKIVVTDDADLTVDFTVKDEEYEIVLR